MEYKYKAYNKLFNAKTGKLIGREFVSGVGNDLATVKKEALASDRIWNKHASRREYEERTKLVRIAKISTKKRKSSPHPHASFGLMRF